MSSDADSFLDVGSVFADQLRQTLIDAVIAWEQSRPRSLQKEIGPSQAGVACARRLAWSMTSNPSANTKGDPLPSIVGTSMHGTMEEVMALANEALGRERWLTETRVLEPIAGTCDLYDKDTRSVIDWKFPGPTAFKKYTTKGPSVEYRSQVHTYGLGYRNLGYEVDKVGIMFIPRAGRLNQSHLWIEDYDQQRALDTAERLKNIRKVSDALELEKYPERAQHIPATPSDSCMFCPWWNPNPRGNRECPGTAGDPNGHLLDLGVPDAGES